MQKNYKIFLPGSNKQLTILLDEVDVKGMTILVMGSGSEEITKRFLAEGAESVYLIVEDNDSLLQSRLILTEEKNAAVRMMEFDNTDFLQPKFDLVYAQASVSGARRNKILKEVKRILKPGGYFCVGENVNLQENPPAFVQHIWENSEIVPLKSDELSAYYSSRKFKILKEEDLSSTLKDFYKMSSDILKEKSDELDQQEKSYYKKILRKMSHESNAYLKLGGDSFIGFKMLIMKKEEN